MSGVGVIEVKLKYPVESSHVYLQYMEYGVGSVYNNNKKLSFESCKRENIQSRLL